MSRYIDADMLINGFISKLDDEETLFNEVARRFIVLLRRIPSIDIVRCKECENWQTDWVPKQYKGVEDLHYCAVADGCKFGDFFCADGERRTDE